MDRLECASQVRTAATTRRLAQLCRRRSDQAEGKQGQTEANGYPGERSPLVIACRQKHADTDREQYWSKKAQVKREQECRERATDVGSQHHRERDRQLHDLARDQGGNDESRRCRALQGDRDDEANAGGEEPVPAANSDETPHLSGEGTGYARAHHAHAP
jgi:hypothetical protein